jgi:hypothetical protein
MDGEESIPLNVVKNVPSTIPQDIDDLTVRFLADRNRSPARSGRLSPRISPASPSIFRKLGAIALIGR